MQGAERTPWPCSEPSKAWVAALRSSAESSRGCTYWLYHLTTTRMCKQATGLRAQPWLNDPRPRIPSHNTRHEREPSA